MSPTSPFKGSHEHDEERERDRSQNPTRLLHCPIHSLPEDPADVVSASSSIGQTSSSTSLPSSSCNCFRSRTTTPTPSNGQELHFTDSTSALSTRLGTASEIAPPTFSGAHASVSTDNKPDSFTKSATNRDAPRRKQAELYGFVKPVAASISSETSLESQQNTKPTTASTLKSTPWNGHGDPEDNTSTFFAEPATTSLIPTHNTPGLSKEIAVPLDSAPLISSESQSSTEELIAADTPRTLLKGQRSTQSTPTLGSTPTTSKDQAHYLTRIAADASPTATRALAATPRLEKDLQIVLDAFLKNITASDATLTLDEDTQMLLDDFIESTTVSDATPIFDKDTQILLDDFIKATTASDATPTRAKVRHFRKILPSSKGRDPYPIDIIPGFFTEWPTASNLTPAKTSKAESFDEATIPPHEEHLPPTYEFFDFFREPSTTPAALPFAPPTAQDSAKAFFNSGTALPTSSKRQLSQDAATASDDGFAILPSGKRRRENRARSSTRLDSVPKGGLRGFPDTRRQKSQRGPVRSSRIVSSRQDNDQERLKMHQAFSITDTARMSPCLMGLGHELRGRITELVLLAASKNDKIEKEDQVQFVAKEVPDSPIIPYYNEASRYRASEGTRARQKPWDIENVALLTVNKQLHEEASRVLYGPKHQFILRNAQMAEWWLTTIGSNAQKLHSLVIEVDSGISHLCVTRERVWYRFFCQLAKEAPQLICLAVNFKAWTNDFNADNWGMSESARDDGLRWRNEVVNLLYKFRGLKAVEILPGEFMSHEEGQKLAQSLTSLP
ncbi:hypothetical protein MMC13_005253 [Lambiella insularis]|nr:hypothetical protein [Lambiella insularis]